MAGKYVLEESHRGGLGAVRAVGTTSEAFVMEVASRLKLNGNVGHSICPVIKDSRYVWG